MVRGRLGRLGHTLLAYTYAGTDGSRRLAVVDATGFAGESVAVAWAWVKLLYRRLPSR